MILITLGDEGSWDFLRHSIYFASNTLTPEASKCPLSIIFTTGNALCAVVFNILCMIDTRVREKINTMLEFIMSFAFNLKTKTQHKQHVKGPNKVMFMKIHAIWMEL